MGEVTKKVNNFIRNHSEQVFLSLLLILACSASFALGKLSEIDRKNEKISIEQDVSQDSVNEAAHGAFTPRIRANNSQIGDSSETGKPIENVLGSYVASKNSTYFHLTTCPGAKLIKEENKIYFNSKEDALAKGLQPAKNCKGLFRP
jgi:hypothetical protein